MKFNLHVFKSRPVLYGGAFVIFFLVVLYMLNKSGGGSAASDTTITAAGPTDAQVAAQTQLAMASISAQTDMAGIQASLQTVQLQTDAATQQAALAANLQLSQAHIAADQDANDTGAQLSALKLQLENQLQMNEDNNSFQIGYSKLAYDSANTQSLIAANLTQNLAAQQLTAFETQSFLSAIPSVKHKDVRTMLINAASNVAGAATSMIPKAPSSALPTNGATMI